MRRTLTTLGVLSASLVATSLVAPHAASVGLDHQSRTAVRAAPAAKPKTFEPDVGVTFNEPTVRGSRKLILDQIINSIRATDAGEQIRVATWYFDNQAASDALIEAAARGVKVQVVVSGHVFTDTWNAVRRALNQDDSDDTFAVKCRGGCRSRTHNMHSKLYMFSRVGTKDHITMVSSSNLTDAAGLRQWNDLLTTGSTRVYDFLARIFDQYTRDKSLRDPFEVKTLGDYRVWVYPVGRRNPQADQLEKVRCHGATGNTGTRDGRTRIRVAVAGWFDSYGQAIADRLRRLSDQGCDVKVVTTLAGRGVNQTLKAPGGRGPVPIRELSWDPDRDGIPNRYLHSKSMAISGVFGDDTSASVVLTGSPNWSTRAAHSEEIWVRLVERPGITRRYLARVDQLFRSPFSSGRVATPADLRQALAAHARVSGQRYPDWLELD